MPVESVSETKDGCMPYAKPARVVALPRCRTAAEGGASILGENVGEREIGRGRGIERGRKERGREEKKKTLLIGLSLSLFFYDFNWRISVTALQEEERKRGKKRRGKKKKRLSAWCPSFHSLSFSLSCLYYS